MTAFIGADAFDYAIGLESGDLFFYGFLRYAYLSGNGRHCQSIVVG